MYFEKEGFADRMKRYCELRQLKETNPYYIANKVMERQYEDLKLYYDKLGYDRIRALGFKESALKNELTRQYRQSEISDRFRVIFEIGQRKTTTEIKRIMEGIFKEYGLKDKGVATHLENYGVRIKSVKVTMPDGQRKNGYEFV